MAKRIDFDKINSVLIRGTNWIGDVVMTFPAIAAVRETLPASRITVLAKPWVADLVRMHPAVDEVLVYERPGRHEGLGGILRLARELRARRFDAAILLQNAIEAAIIARLAGIPVRAGYSTDARGLLLTHPVRLEARIKTVHQSLYYVEMLEALGFTPSRAPLALAPTEAQRIAAERHLERFGIAGRRPIVGMAPGAAYGPAKRWFADRFAAVADRLAQRHACPILLFGSDGDRASTEAVQAAAKTPLVDIAGRTNLSDAIALIARCDLFVTNDSGLMHVAGALGVPTVAIFGSTNPKTTYPLGERTVLVRRPVDCSPCLKKVCPTDFRCMDLVTVDEVAGESMRLLAESGYRLGGTMEGPFSAVFMDRDGTLNEEVSYLSRMEQLRLYPQTLEAVRMINAAGMKAVVVTNQSGVARGYFTEEFVRSVHERINELLQAGGARIDGFYVCPHHPVYGNGIYKQDCTCRKPKPGLLLRAAAELNIDLSRSYMIGDMLKDVEAGKTAGAKGILVRTGYGSNIVRTDMPAFIAEDILEAVLWIMRDRKG